MIPGALARLLEGGQLSREEAAGIMRALTEGGVPEALLGGLLVAIRMRGESPEVLAGFASVMRDRAVRIHPTRRPLLDTCGTGGDGTDSVNISTAAALVAAACGVAVAKHGNRSASSRCGSADVLERLGLRLDLSAEQLTRCVDEVGIGFLFAAAMHPSMRHVAPTRRALGVRTLFNMMGPLTNPAGATHQLLGAFSTSAAEVMAGALALLGTEKAWVVNGDGGMDELSATGPSIVFEVEKGRVKRLHVEPAALGVQPPAAGGVKGGDVGENARRLRLLLDGAPDAAASTVALNAGAALYLVSAASSLDEGHRMAAESIRSGAPGRKLDELVIWTQRA